MFDKISYTWSLFSASWDVLRRDKGLVLFPLLSGLCCLLVVASFAAPVAYTGAWKHFPGRHADPAKTVAYYAVLFLFYFCNYFVITFFNTAVVACAIRRLQGGEPTIAYGFSEAMSRLPLIVGWALVSATVGVVLRLVAERSGKVGEFITGLLGAAWSVATYLAVPVLVVRGVGPVAAVKESTRLLKKTWGEQLVGNFAFGWVFFLLSLPAVFLFFLAVYVAAGTHNLPLAAAVAGIAVVYFIALALVHSALTSIFQAAVYLYTENLLADAPGGFPVRLVSGAMRAN